MIDSEPTSVIDALFQWQQTIPNKNAFCFIDNKGECSTSITYSELFVQSHVFAENFLKDVNEGDRVALILPTGPEFLLAFFGCLLAKTIPVPLSQPTRQHGMSNLKHILKNSKPKLCITTSFLLESLTAECENLEPSYRPKVINFTHSDLIELANKTKTTTPITDSAYGDIAFLQYTSGSTSAPKGVKVSHQNIIANHKMIREVFGHDINTRQLNWMPLYHDMGLIGHVLHPICNGHTSFLMDPFVFVQRPRIWLEAISFFRITSTGGPNFCYQHCVKRIKPHSIQSLDLSCLRVAYNGAEPINPSVIEAFTELCEPIGFNNDAFLPCFGLAEATLLVSGIRHDEKLNTISICKDSIAKGIAVTSSNDSSNPNQETVFASLGKAATGIEILIVDKETQENCSNFTIGEVWIRGDNITLGYWENAQATLDTYVIHNNKRYLKTGDLGFLDGSLQLFITGRLKDLIIIDGKNHYPQDIEYTTQTVDDILKENACAAFASDITRNQNDFNHSKLIVIQELDRRYRTQSTSDSLFKIKEKIKFTINQQHSISVSDVVLIDCNTMPKTTSGKIKRHQAKYLYENNLLKEIATIN